jgi:hypothetical protein
LELEQMGVPEELRILRSPSQLRIRSQRRLPQRRRKQINRQL